MVPLGTLPTANFPKYSFLGFDYNSPLWIPLVIVTFPVNITLFGLVMVDNSISSILILQTIVFFIIWLTSYKLILYYSKIKNNNITLIIFITEAIF